MEARAKLVTINRSCLLSRLATGFLTTNAGVSASVACMLSRVRMLVAAAPTTRKQVSVIMAIDLVKQYSVSAVGPSAIVTETSC
jgi:hypothetical protein